MLILTLGFIRAWDVETLLKPLPQQLRHITRTMEDCNYLQWLSLRPIHNQVRKDRKEAHVGARQVRPAVSGSLGANQKEYFFANDAFHAVGSGQRAVLLDVSPNLYQIASRSGREDIAIH